MVNLPLFRLSSCPVGQEMLLKIYLGCYGKCGAKSGVRSLRKACWGRERMSVWGYNLAQEDEAPNVLLCDVPELPAAPWGSERKAYFFISSTGNLLTTLKEKKKKKPFTADVITASCSNCVRTNQCRLSGSGEDPREAQEKSISRWQWCGEQRLRGAKLVGKEIEGGKQRAASSDYIRYFINISLRKQNHPEYH